VEIYVDGNYSNIRFSAAHFIPGEWKCSRIHGHDYSLSARIMGDMGEDSYFMDFSVAKSRLKEIADRLDHRVLIPRLSTKMKIEEGGGSVNVNINGKRYTFPSEECVIIPVKDTTAECLSEYILSEFLSIINERVKQVDLEVREGPGQYAKSSWKRD